MTPAGQIYAVTGFCCDKDEERSKKKKNKKKRVNAKNQVYVVRKTKIGVRRVKSDVIIG